MRQADRELAASTIKTLLRLAKLQTMSEKYEQLSPGIDGRIRTVLSVVGTETGRLSSSGTFLEPSTNLQNQPKKVAMLDELYDTRRCFVPSEGCTFIEADLKQAEAIATACYSEDDELLGRMTDGEDIHVWTASHVFSILPSAVSTEQRHLGKVARHALNYGMGWQTFMTTVNNDADLTGIAISAAEAKRIHKAYHRLHPRLQRWWDEIGQTLRTRGYLVNAFGRRRDFFGRKDSSGGPSHETLKEGIAFLPQSTIADHLNGRLVELFKKEQRVGFKMLLQIHDAILLECPGEKAKMVAAIVRATIEGGITINGRDVRVLCEISVGESWGTMGKIA